MALRYRPSPRLSYPQDRLTSKIASDQPGSCRADRAPVRIDRYQRAKPTVGQQLEQSGKPLACPLDLDIARQIEPLNAPVASQHEVTDREGCLLTSADTVEDRAAVVFKTRQKPAESGSADTIDNGAEFRNDIELCALGRDDRRIDTQRFGQRLLIVASEEGSDVSSHEARELAREISNPARGARD